MGLLVKPEPSSAPSLALPQGVKLSSIVLRVIQSSQMYSLQFLRITTCHRGSSGSLEY